MSTSDKSAASSKRSLKARMRAGEFLLGAFIPAACAELVDIASYTGFDFVALDTEHGPMGPGEIAQLIRAAEAGNLPVLVRVPLPTKDHILRALDSGATGIIVPQIESAEAARECVMQTQYPPVGNRGSAFYARTHRFTQYSGWDALDRANENVITGVMIESLPGLANADAICAVPGVDFILYGAGDMHVAIGRGAHYEAECKNAYDKVLAATRAAGLPIGIPAPSAEAARQHAQAGFQIVVTGLLPMLLNAATKFTREARG